MPQGLGQEGLCVHLFECLLLKKEKPRASAWLDSSGRCLGCRGHRSSCLMAWSSQLLDELPRAEVCVKLKWKCVRSFEGNQDCCLQFVKMYSGKAACKPVASTALCQIPALRDSRGARGRKGQHQVHGCLTPLLDDCLHSPHLPWLPCKACTFDCFKAYMWGWTGTLGLGTRKADDLLVRDNPRSDSGQCSL